MCVEDIKLTIPLTKSLWILRYFIFQEKMLVVLASLCKICHHNCQDVAKAVVVFIVLLCPNKQSSAMRQLFCSCVWVNILRKLTSSARVLTSASVCDTPTKLRKAKYSILWQAEHTCLYTWYPRRILKNKAIRRLVNSEYLDTSVIWPTGHLYVHFLI